MYTEGRETHNRYITNQRMSPEELPDGLVVRILGIHCHGPGSIPSRGRSPQAASCARKKKKKKHQRMSPVTMKENEAEFLSFRPMI